MHVCHVQKYSTPPTTYGSMVEWFTIPACHAVWYGFESRYSRQSQFKETYSS